MLRKRLQRRDTVNPEVAKVVPQLAPGGEHRNLDVIDERERTYHSLCRLVPGVEVADAELAFLADCPTHRLHVDARHRGAPGRDVQAVNVNAVAGLLRQ